MRVAQSVARLARAGVEHLIHQGDADEAVLDFQIEPAQPLGRLIGEQQRADEGDEGAGVLAAIDDAPAAIEDDACDRQAAERVGERVRHRLDGRDLVGGALDIAHGRGHALAHAPLEIVGFDDPHALRGLEHDVEDARHPIEGADARSNPV